jgi:uncharacterized protein
MKLHLDNAAGNNLFTGYGAGYISVNHQRYETSIVVAPGHDVATWDVSSFDSLAAANFEKLLELDPQVVLFGSGERLRFPHSELTRALIARHIGVEVMDTKAACRTYNILATEGRKVVAALLI